MDEAHIHTGTTLRQGQGVRTVCFLNGPITGKVLLTITPKIYSLM